MKYLKEIAFLILSVLLYVLIFYSYQRSEFYPLMLIYTSLFVLYFFALKTVDVKSLNLAVLLFPLISLLALPTLSDDFYRFLWDGKIIGLGENPFLHKPVHYYEKNLFSDSLTPELYLKMNSPNYFSVYPPINQLFFYFSALFTNTFYSVLAIKVIILMAYYGIWFFGTKLTEKFSLPKNSIYWFLLNPLVLIESLGNVHFEVVMVFFLVVSLYFLSIEKLGLSALLFSFAVCTKLIPMLFLPAIFIHLKLKKGLIYSISVGFIVLLTFVPFINIELFSNIANSLDLYIQTFEFNAGIYYVVRWLGFQIYGYNIIQTAGILLSLISLFSIAVVSFLPKLSLIEKMLYSITIYYVFASIVHPWYIILPLFLSIMNKKGYAVLWSLVVFLSYSAYSNLDYNENYFLIAIEYLFLFGAIAFEFAKKTILKIE